MKKIINKTISSIAVICIFLSLCFTVSAEETNKAVVEAQNGVVKIWGWINVYDKELSDSNKKVVEEGYLWTGSGFLIGTEGVSKTVVTNAHVVTMTAEDTAFMNSLITQIPTAKSWELIIKVSVVNDIKIASVVKQKSEAMDYAILEMSQPIYTKTNLKLMDSDKVNVTDTVYALGYPGIAGDLELKQTASVENITVTKGAISKITVASNQAPVFQHTALISGGNSGGPLVSEDAAVIGINTWIDAQSGQYLFATRINEIRKALDALGVAYTLVGDTSVASSSATSSEKSDISSSGEKESSATSSAKFDQESSGLIKGVDNSVVFIVGGILFAVILLVIVLAVLFSKGKKANTVPAGAPRTPNGYIPPQYNVPQQGNSPVPQQYSVPQQNTPPVPQQYQSSAPETTVLSAGASNETTVLGAGSAATTTVHLLRRKTGEKIMINKPLFKIGKERTAVDYFVGDNSAISRNHAFIITKNGEYFIVDNKTTNHTYVNDEIIPSNNENKLSHGDKIRLANEEFEFKLF